jgi:hypothetical protein
MKDELTEGFFVDFPYVRVICVVNCSTAITTHLYEPCAAQFWVPIHARLRSLHCRFSVASIAISGSESNNTGTIGVEMQTKLTLLDLKDCSEPFYTTLAWGFVGSH